MFDVCVIYRDLGCDCGTQVKVSAPQLSVLTQVCFGVVMLPISSDEQDAEGAWDLLICVILLKVYWDISSYILMES